MSAEKAASLETLKELTLSALASHCTRETERYFHGESFDPNYCFEIFRRAGEESDQQAWEILYAQYHALAHGWILRHPAFPASKTEPQDCLNEAFARLWQALEGENFKRFSNLASILRFFQMCIHSVIVDHARKLRLIEISIDAKRIQLPRSDDGSRPEELIENEEQRRALWGYVRSRLKDDQEVIVIYENFVLDLKSRQKLERHSDLFPLIQDVYRVKQNVLTRLQRDERLSKRFRDDA